jgi:hypothetical protein
VTTAWVAGSVRAKALARRRLGIAGTRRLARSRDLQEALGTLVRTSYGHDVRIEQTLAEAQHAVAACMLWHLRVLSGWVPREGADMLRILAGGFEIANVDEQVRALRGESTEPPFRLGALAAARGRLAHAASLAELRAVLSGSAWGDPGADTAAAIHLGLRLSWAARVAIGVPRAEPWAAGAAALLLARETIVAGHRLPATSARTAESVLGSTWVEARTLRDFAAALPPSARWAIADLGQPEELWRAEAAWWRRVEDDGFALLRTAAFGDAAVLGAVGVLAVDSWRVRAALEAAARGGLGPEVFDAMA